MRVAGIRSESLMDGDGVNLVVFTQGCHINCPGCHNKELQDPEGGSDRSYVEILTYLTPVTTGLVVSGGEPTEQWLEVCLLAESAKTAGLRTTLYTGNTLEALKAKSFYEQLLHAFDYIKAGPYVESLRTTTNGPIGSTNQIIYNTVELRKELGYAEDEL